MTKVQPSSRPGKLPRVRRGMYRPASIISQADTLAEIGTAAAVALTAVRERRAAALRDGFDFNFPSL